MNAYAIYEHHDKRTATPVNSAKDLAPILSCPICNGDISANLACLNCGKTFPVLNDQPAMFNFDKSIFTRDGIVPNLEHRISGMKSSTLGRLLQNITYGGPSEQSKANVDALVKICEARNNPRVLIIGGGTVGTLAELYGREAINIVGTDVYASDITTLACDAHHMPSKDGVFDAVVIQAVLEHVLDPALVVHEIFRVLADDGVVYAETPFMQHVHEGAYDFTRFTRSGHRWLFRNFTQIRAGSLLGPGIMLLWSIRYFLRSLGFGAKLTALITSCFFWIRFIQSRQNAPQNDDASSGFFFMGTKSQSPLRANQMPAYYDAR
ncbi:methyltransferase domain-containing protein [Novosphingobium sp. FSY-8]|uniref:Methyltransferase domain-containing protein n=1 Tax=Novosphingobium ovatum TaxID=1908523 RepID=A0ABW9XBK9_9SPHN|nr:class I SAM-dependent methyltransferase [Novosphingobium ovatum]NBC35931.1 methyltransferase domain-containing protein [Novosphingobium ovatum]